MAGRQSLLRFRPSRIHFLQVIVEYRPGINTQVQVDAETSASDRRPLHTAHICEASVLSAERYRNNPPLNGSAGFHRQDCIHRPIARLRPMRRHYGTYTVTMDETH